ncbi:MAG: hypothetical protein DHS20C16_05430 [Phycisphaerae bacterium]|nr:MAG: hypothetical protein DHS20C16_05430 [Phycisphaerae bacterium]
MTTANALCMEEDLVMRQTSCDAAAPKTRRRWVFRAIAVCLALAVCELQLQLASLCIPAVRQALLPAHLQSNLDSDAPAMLIPDVMLGVRGNPEYPGHDALGFRNAQVYEHPDVVAIGDSQTHSTHDKSWPALYESDTGHTTYNMGIAGWGPAEYVLVLDAALRRKPKVVVVGLYMGNDVADAYRSVVLRQSCYDLGTSVFPEGIDAIENEDLWNAKVRSQFIHGIDATPKRHSSGVVSMCRNALSDHCKLYGLARAMKNAAVYHFQGIGSDRDKQDRQWARNVRWSKRHPKTSILEVDHQRTILTPAYRSALLNMSDERIDVGFQLTLESITRISKRCRERNVELVVAIIPTKEWVLDTVIESRHEYLGMTELINHESMAQESITTFLSERKIDFVNVGRALRECVRSGQQPYPMSTDGHPNAIGNKAIAKAIAAHTDPLLKQHQLASTIQSNEAKP